MIIDRWLTPILQESSKSILLLGPRQTGKSTLIRSLHADLAINLTDEGTYLEFARNPHQLVERLAAQPKVRTVFIDEIQRLPGLLNTIQGLIDENPRRFKFFLTGSSARKLRRGNANLLPGRIHHFELGPLYAGELDFKLETKQALATGLLPGIYCSEDTREREKTLRSYAATYIKEEVQAEALTRNLEGFSRFLFVAAYDSGRFLDLTKLASEAQISRQSAIRYFEVLEDTLLVRRCLPFAKNSRRRLVQHPKFHFFDTGVLNALLENFVVSDDRKGFLFEHLFVNQLYAGAQCRDREIRVSTYRTEHGAEVDFIVEYVGKVWAIELKASANVGKSDLLGFTSFSEYYNKPHHKIVACWVTHPRKISDVLILPWQEVLEMILK